MAESRHLNNQHDWKVRNVTRLNRVISNWSGSVGMVTMNVKVFAALCCAALLLLVANPATASAEPEIPSIPTTEQQVVEAPPVVVPEQPAPQPVPVPEPAPVPMPQPVPEPAPEPAPPAPAPVPVPVPEPVVTPAPQKTPVPPPPAAETVVPEVTVTTTQAPAPRVEPSTAVVPAPEPAPRETEASTTSAAPSPTEKPAVETTEAPESTETTGSEATEESTEPTGTTASEAPATSESSSSPVVEGGSNVDTTTTTEVSASVAGTEVTETPLTSVPLEELPVLQQAAVSDDVKQELKEQPVQDPTPVTDEELAEIKDWDFARHGGGHGPTTTTSSPTTTSPTATTTSTTRTRPSHPGGHGPDRPGRPGRPPVWQHPSYDPFGHPLFYNPRYEVTLKFFIRDLATGSVRVVIVPPRSSVPVNVCGNGHYGFAAGLQTPNFGLQLMGSGTFSGYGCHPQGGWRPPPRHVQSSDFVWVHAHNRFIRIEAFFYLERTEYWNGCGCDRQYGYTYLRDNGEQMYGYRYVEPETRREVFVPEQTRSNPIAGPMQQGAPGWSYPDGGLDPAEAPQKLESQAATPDLLSADENQRHLYVISGGLLLAAVLVIALILRNRKRGRISVE